MLRRTFRPMLLILGVAVSVPAFAQPSFGQPYIQAITPSFTATIDLGSNAVVSRMATGEAVTVSPDAKSVYVVNRDQVFVYRDNQVYQVQLPASSFQKELLVTPDSKKLFVLASRQMSIIDTASLQVVATVAMPAGRGLASLAPDGKRIYYTVGDGVVIDTATNTILGSLGAPQGLGIAVSPDGSRIYVGNQYHASPGYCNVPDAPLIQVMDARSGAVLKELRPGGSSCVDVMAISPDGKTIYFGDISTSQLRSIDTESYANLSVIDLPGGVRDLAFTPSGTKLLAAVFNTGVVVIDTYFRRVTDTIGLGGEVTRLAVKPLPPYFAGLHQGRFAPGSIVTLGGYDLAHGTQAASGSPLPVSLLETSVYVNQTRAPLYFVSHTRIDAQIPYETGLGPVLIRIERNGLTTGAHGVEAWPLAPAIFTLDIGNRPTPPGVIAHASTSALVTPTAPARPGEFVVIYASGLGKLVLDLPSGTAASQPIATVEPCQVTVGYVPATVTYCGAAPGFPGLYQVNIQLPDNVPRGPEVSVVIQQGLIASNMVTMAIEAPP